MFATYRSTPLWLALVAAVLVAACGGEPAIRVGSGPDDDPAPAPTTSAPATSDRASSATAPPGEAAIASGDTAALDTPEAPARTPATPDHGDRTAAADSPTYSDGDVLEKGAEGDDVATLQRRLADLGYWVGNADGHYGELTRQAVLAFQGWEGLTRDGKVGPATRRALENAERPQPERHGDLIEIHRPQQILLVVRDGVTRWAFHTSTGSGQRYRHPSGHVAVADTPPGTWTISWQVDGWRESDLGRLWRPKYFHDDGIAIHGYPEVPAHPASHGCARVTMQAMDFIWAKGLAPEGSTVVVH